MPGKVRERSFRSNCKADLLRQNQTSKFLPMGISSDDMEQPSLVLRIL